MSHLLQQYSTTEALLFFINSLVFMLSALIVALSTLPKENRDILTNQDSDGRMTMFIGFLVLLAGMLVPDYAGAYALTAIGLAMMAYGGFVAVEDGKTDKILNNPIMLVLFTLIAASTFYYGATHQTGSVVVNPFLMVWLTIIAGIGSVFATFLALSFSTAEFKARVLPTDELGKMLMKRSVFVMLTSPFAGTNPALMTAAAALGFFLFALGALIAAREETTARMLKTNKAPIYLVLMIALFVIARLGLSAFI